VTHSLLCLVALGDSTGARGARSLRAVPPGLWKSGHGFGTGELPNDCVVSDVPLGLRSLSDAILSEPEKKYLFGTFFRTF